MRSKVRSLVFANIFSESLDKTQIMKCEIDVVLHKLTQVLISECRYYE